MRVVMYGTPLGAGGAMTEIPFLLNNQIERIYKDAADLQDLECDIAIANFTRDPENSGNKNGYNYLKLPKAKVQLAIQAEHYDEYIPEWVDGITHNFDGSICFPFNKPFWDFDDSVHPCFAKSYWEEKEFKIKPVFYFNPLVKWNDFYKGPIKEFGDFACMMGSTTIHRNRIVENSSGKVVYTNGDARQSEIQETLKKSGIAYNSHKFQLKGLCPETDKTEIKYMPKTELIRLAYFYNMGMAVVTEKLDHTFPENFKDNIIEVDDLEKYDINKEKLLEQTLDTEKIFNQSHDLNYELDLLIDNICGEFNLC